MTPPAPEGWVATGSTIPERPLKPGRPSKRTPEAQARIVEAPENGVLPKRAAEAEAGLQGLPESFCILARFHLKARGDRALPK